MRLACYDGGKSKRTEVTYVEDLTLFLIALVARLKDSRSCDRRFSCSADYWENVVGMSCLRCCGEMM